jgi:hypothetical protein
VYEPGKVTGAIETEDELHPVAHITHPKQIVRNTGRRLLVKIKIANRLNNTPRTASVFLPAKILPEARGAPACELNAEIVSRDVPWAKTSVGVAVQARLGALVMQLRTTYPLKPLIGLIVARTEPDRPLTTDTIWEETVKLKSDPLAVSTIWTGETLGPNSESPGNEAVK